VDEFWYGGVRQKGLEVSVALTNCGDMQLELIQQRCDTPSMFQDFLAAGHEGMQHFAVWPDDWYSDRIRAFPRQRPRMRIRASSLGSIPATRRTKEPRTVAR
jgi:hypothetical protein